MNNTFLLIDTSNLFYRGRHTITGSTDLKLGMAFHITFNSIRKAWQKFQGHHLIFFLEGRSWRKDFYAPYKRNRVELRAAHTEKEAEEEQVFWEAFDTFKQFIVEKTNCTVLQHPQLEADDLIAGWIKHHPNDNHVIISTDSDFLQLIAPNVKQYNGVTETTITIDGFYDDKNRPIIDKKTGEAKLAPNPEWLLFEKCIRGDTSDNIFSAYPGARTKGTSKKVGLTEAFEDRKSKGYSYNNFMLQRWVDHDGVEHKVLDDYHRNRTLIDLSSQPDHIQSIIREAVSKVTEEKKEVSQVGVKLLKFCALYDLKRISDQISSYTTPLNASYPL